MVRKKSNRKINIGLIQSKYSYNIEELAKKINVCKGTVNNMIKQGLSIIKGSYPYLIYGQDAIDFIGKKQRKEKIKLNINQFRCFKCRTSVEAKNNNAILEELTPKVGNLKSNCAICGTKINKRISLKKLPEIKKILNIGKGLDGFILIIDLINLNFRKVKIKKRKNCFCK